VNGDGRISAPPGPKVQRIKLRSGAKSCGTLARTAVIGSARDQPLPHRCPTGASPKRPLLPRVAFERNCPSPKWAPPLV
jgi:hypothetical protein